MVVFVGLLFLQVLYHNPELFEYLYYSIYQMNFILFFAF